MLRAIDDPADRVSLVAALRSSFFGVSDRDIVQLPLSAGGCARLGRGRRVAAGRRALAPGAGACWRSCTTQRTRVSRARAAGAALRRDAGPGRAHGHAPRRGRRSRTWRRWRRSRARPAELGVLTAARLRAPARGAHPERARGARPAVDAAGRSRHRAHPLDPQGQGPGGAGRGALRHRRRAFSRGPTAIALWDEGRIAIGFRARLPAAGLGRARAPAEEATGARRRPPPALRRLHARARPAGGPAAAGRRADRRLLAASCRQRAAADARRRRAVVDADTLPRAERAGARHGPRGAGGRRGRRRAGRALGRASGGADRGARPSGRSCPSPPRAARRAQRAVRGRRAAAASGGRDFGSLVHRLLEWIPLDDAPARGRAARWPRRWRPSFGLDAGAPRRARRRSVGARSPCP